MTTTFRKLFSAHTRLYGYFALLVILGTASVFPELFSGFSPYRVDAAGLCPPGRGHLLGTDFLGRDMLSRTLVAGRISFAAGVFARLASVAIGFIIGAAAGLLPRPVRAVCNGVIEVFLSIPALLLAMGLAAVMSAGFVSVTIAVVLGMWAPVARFTSVLSLEISKRDYVTAARAAGAGGMYIMIKHVFPSMKSSLVSLMTTGIAGAVMMESTLSFLGLAGSTGVDSVPSWGMLINQGAKFMFDAPWLIVGPAVCLTLMVLLFNQAGDILSEEPGSPKK